MCYHRSMGGKIPSLYILVGIIVVVGLFVGGLFAFRSVILGLPAENTIIPTNFLGNRNTGSVGSHVSEAPGFAVRRKNKNTVVVEWTNLPAGTARIDAYRVRQTANGTELIYWESIPLGPDAGSGSKEFSIGPNDNPDAYLYYFQTAGANGTILWTSSSTQITTSSLFGTPAGPEGNPNQNNNPSNGNNPPSNPQNPTPSTPAPTSTPPVSSPTSTASEPTSTVVIPPPETPPPVVYYYTPQGQLSSTASSGPPTATFYVYFLNGNIQINWQNLPAGTDSLVVDRSASGDGPWTELMEQTNPADPGTLGVLDQTVQDPYYYQMEARGADNVIATYGPVFLPGLTQ